MGKIRSWRTWCQLAGAFLAMEEMMGVSTRSPTHPLVFAIGIGMYVAAMMPWRAIRPRGED